MSKTTIDRKIERNHKNIDRLLWVLIGSVTGFVKLIMEAANNDSIKQNQILNLITLIALGIIVASTILIIFVSISNERLINKEK